MNPITHDTPRAPTKNTNFAAGQKQLHEKAANRRAANKEKMLNKVRKQQAEALQRSNPTESTTAPLAEPLGGSPYAVNVDDDDDDDAPAYGPVYGPVPRPRPAARSPAQVEKFRTMILNRRDFLRDNLRGETFYNRALAHKAFDDAMQAAPESQQHAMGYAPDQMARKERASYQESNRNGKKGRFKITRGILRGGRNYSIGPVNDVMDRNERMSMPVPVKPYDGDDRNLTQAMATYDNPNQYPRKRVIKYVRGYYKVPSE